MQKTEINISGNLSRKSIFRVPMMIIPLIIITLILSSENCFAQSSITSTDQSINADAVYLVSAFTLPDNKFGYLIKSDGVNVFISHNRGTGEINAPDYNTEEEALTAGEIKIVELKNKLIPTNSATIKNK